MLALLLLPIMDKTAKEHNTFPHISVVSSEAHFRGDIPTEALKSDAILKKMSDPKYCGFKWAVSHNK
jgi:retinol dehydrogenase-12